MPVNNRGARKHVDRARKEIWNQQRPLSQHKFRRLWQRQLALREWATDTSDRTTLMEKGQACLNYPARNLHLLLFPQLWSNSATVFLLARSSTRPASAPKPSLTTRVPVSSLSLFHMPLITYWETLNYTGWQRTSPPPLASSPAANKPKVPSCQKLPCFIFSLYFILNR